LGKEKKGFPFGVFNGNGKGRIGPLEKPFFKTGTKDPIKVPKEWKLTSQKVKPKPI